MALSVLVVEDNRLNQELICDLLEASRHRVEIVAEGEAFRRRISAGDPPDIVVMDILLPDTDGITLLTEMRERAGLAAVPVVAVTAQALSGDRERFLAAGFDAVMTKPINTRTFVAEIEAHAARREAHGEDTHRR